MLKFILHIPSSPLRLLNFVHVTASSATKKAKLFFHPDKIPKDLTENQTHMFSNLWLELCDKESKFFG